MNAVTGFIAIVSLLLALAAGGGTTEPQAATTRKAGEGQKEMANPQRGGGCPPFMCGADGNHNETLVRDMAPMN